MMKTEETKEAIRSGGFHSVKSKRIKEFYQAVSEKFGGEVSSVLALREEEARRMLMDLSRIGKKTADVLVAYSIPTLKLWL